MAFDLQRDTIRALRDLHARELMRLGWYRQARAADLRHKRLRERKATHQAFLRDLLRRRDRQPLWYARLFYYAGHVFGVLTTLMPGSWARTLERTLERWLLLRYQRYYRELQLHLNLRSMVEAIQLRRLDHNEPARDVLALLETYIRDEQALLHNLRPQAPNTPPAAGPTPVLPTRPDFAPLTDGLPKAAPPATQPAL